MLRLSYKGKSRQKSITMPNWAFGLMAAGSAALGVAIFLLISTLAILLLPLLLVAGGVTAFVMRKRIERMLRMGGFPASGAGRERPDFGPEDAAVRMSRRRAQQRVKPDIEDADYRVVEEPPRKR